MKKFKFEFITDKDFEIGDCDICPLGYYDNKLSRKCVVEVNGYNLWKDCPIEVNDEDNEYNLWKACPIEEVTDGKQKN